MYEDVVQGVRVMVKKDATDPNYYKTAKLECWDVMEEVFGKEALEHFMLLNAFKYIFRHQNKNGLEDLKKARVYLDKLIKSKERDND